MTTKKILLIVFIVITLVGLSFSQASAQTLRVSHEMSPSDEIPAHAYMLTFEYYVEKHSDMEVEIYPDNVLGGMEEIIEQMQEGYVNLAQLSLGGLSAFYPRALMFNFDYVYPDNERIIRKLWLGETEFMQDVFEEIEEEVGIKPFGLLRRGGWTVITNSARPIETLEDMEGLTMRGMDSSQVRAWEAMGADGVVVPWEEIYTALQTGVADGQRNPPAIFLDASLDEVQDYVSFPGLSPGSGIIAVDSEWYTNLSEEDRKVIDYAAEQAMQVAYGLSYRAGVLEIGQLEDSGMEITHKSQEEFERFREVVLEEMIPWAYERFGEEFTENFLDEVERLEEEYGF